MENRRRNLTLEYLDKPQKDFPRKINLHSVNILSGIVLFLYLIVSIFYIIVILDKNKSALFSLISIIEIVITGISIVTCCISTHVSNYINENINRLLEKINRNNEPQHTINIEEVNDKQRRAYNEIRCIERVCIGVYIFYFVVLFVCKYILHGWSWDFFGVVLGSISTLLTIVLAWITTVSYFNLTNCFLFMLKTIEQTTNDLSDKLNDLEISKSQQELLRKI